MAETITFDNVPFTWEGTDSRGKRVKGKTMAGSEAAVRAELRRQGVVPVRVRKQTVLFQKKGKVNKNKFMLQENAGLYWHLVDLIWIYLFPLFYLIK